MFRASLAAHEATAKEGPGVQATSSGRDEDTAYLRLGYGQASAVVCGVR